MTSETRLKLETLIAAAIAVGQPPGRACWRAEVDADLTLARGAMEELLEGFEANLDNRLAEEEREHEKEMAEAGNRLTLAEMGRRETDKKLAAVTAELEKAHDDLAKAAGKIHDLQWHRGSSNE